MKGVEKMNKNVLFNILATLSIVIMSVMYQTQYKRHMEELLTHRRMLNNTLSSDESYLIFNRVPKAGSEMLWGMINKLAIVNNFTSYSDSAKAKNERGSENTYLPDQASRKVYVDMWRSKTLDMVADISNLNKMGSDDFNFSRPFSYVKHLNFLDTTEFGVAMPIYINIVRHPVDRVYAWYYYIRAPWYVIDPSPQDIIVTNNMTNAKNSMSSFNVTDDDSAVQKRIWNWKKGKQPNLRFLKTSYLDCLKNSYYECQYLKGSQTHAGYQGGSHKSQIAFFCGMHPDCDEFESEKALQRAKANVEKHYAVVAVLEDIHKSLYVLENYIPKYFRSVRDVYDAYMKENKKGKKGVNKNLYKPKMPKEVRNTLMQNFTMEIDFYEFCKARLQKQYLALL